MGGGVLKVVTWTTKTLCYKHLGEGTTGVRRSEGGFIVVGVGESGLLQLGRGKLERPPTFHR